MTRQIGDSVWVARIHESGPEPFVAKITAKKGAYYQVEGWLMWWSPEELTDSVEEAKVRAGDRYRSFLRRKKKEVE